MISLPNHWHDVVNKEAVEVITTMSHDCAGYSVPQRNLRRKQPMLNLGMEHHILSRR